VEPPARGEPPASLIAGPLAAGPLAGLVAFVLVLVAVLALREVADLVVPIVFGLFLALVAWPMVGALERRGARRPIALSGAILVVLAVVLAAAGIIALSVGELVVQVPRYEDRLREQIDALRDLLAGFGVAADEEAIASIVSPSSIVSFVRPVASAVSSAGAAIVILAITLFYALAGGPSLRARAQAAFGERHPLLVGVERFGVDLRRYLLVRAQLGLFAAVLTLALLWLLGVPYPALWAFLVFAASFIPNVGFIIALVPPMVLAFLDAGLLVAAAVVVGYVIINFLQDHLLQPVVMGSELNLSPLVVLVSVIAWAWILGAAGALLAVPMTLLVVMALEAFPSSRPVAALMRNRVGAPPGIVDRADGGPTEPGPR
jgi:predicted PurR-regulated permease PerM